ncbi:MAG: aminoacyl-tRNA hydrolase [Clostridiales bacterium]|nr:aminoacyl-tRNA hydrolase [Clostridiales bacterium]
MFSFRKKKPETEAAGAGVPEFLIVGLGNPGQKYENTRHNTGFLCMQLLEEKYGFCCKRLKFKSLTDVVTVGGHRCLAMKPQTFMNSSGEAVAEAAGFYKIPPERVVVIFDDTSLPVGSLRIRRKGSAGGHNGIKSIILCLNSDNFPRIKIGIGAKPHPDYDLVDYVLSSFKKDEIPQMKSAMEKAAEVLPVILDGDIERAMNLANS